MIELRRIRSPYEAQRTTWCIMAPSWDQAVSGITSLRLRALGLNEAEIDEKFGFLLDALAAGAPPHGGIALGVDRIVQRFTGSGSLRDVIAFPKTTAARALFEGAPTALGDSELEELGLIVKRRETEEG